MKQNYIVVPARAGSKGIANKNSIKVRGRSLAVRSLVHARNILPDENIILSTDSEKIISEVDQDYKNLRELIHEDKRWIDLVAKWMTYKVKNDDLPRIDKLSRNINIDYPLLLI